MNDFVKGLLASSLVWTTCLVVFNMSLTNSNSNALPVVIGTFRNCDILRGFDEEKNMYFYIQDCSPSRLSQISPFS